MKEKVKGLLCALGYMGLWFFVQVVTGGIIGMAIGISHMVGLSQEEMLNVQNNTKAIEQQVGEMLPYILLISSIIGILLLWVITACCRQKFREKIVLTKPTVNSVLLGALIALGMYCVNVGIVNLLQKVDFLQGSFNRFIELSKGLGEGPFILTILAVGIIVPLGEEILFRGFIYQTLKKRYSVLWAILLQGMFFGLFHMNIIQSIYTMLLGVILGYMVYRTGSLWTAIVMHMVNNILPFTFGKLLSQDNGGMPLTAILLGVGVIITFIGITFVRKQPMPVVITSSETGGSQNDLEMD